LVVLICKCWEISFPTLWMGLHMGPRTYGSNLLANKNSSNRIDLCFGYYQPEITRVGLTYVPGNFQSYIMGLQSRGSPNRCDFGIPTWESQPVRFRDSHSGVPRKKNHLDVGFVASHGVYYKGEGGGFPRVWAMVSLVCLCCSWLVLAPRVLQLCTNHFVWVVCKPMWVSETCQLFLVLSRNSNTPFYPSKCCELGSVPWFLPLPLSSTWTHIWILQGVENASHGLLILEELMRIESDLPSNGF